MGATQTLAVHVTPRANKDEVLGLRTNEEGAQEVSVRVTAPPDAGKANKAVCKLIAKELGIPKTSVSVKRGETARHKLLELDCTEDVLQSWISKLSSLGV